MLENLGDPIAPIQREVGIIRHARAETRKRKLGHNLTRCLSDLNVIAQDRKD